MKPISINTTNSLKNISKQSGIHIQTLISYITKLNIKNNINLTYKETITLLEYINIPFSIKNNIEKINNVFKNDINNNILKPPVISVVGHVDHGKTSLIKTLCQEKFSIIKTNITHNISIHMYTYNNNNVYMIDTPGHELLDNIKKYGAYISDIVLLVISISNNIEKDTLQIIYTLNQKNMLDKCIIVFTKSDIISADTRDNKINDMMTQIKKHSNVAYVQYIIFNIYDKDSIETLKYTIQSLYNIIPIYYNDSCYGNGLVIDTIKVNQSNALLIRLDNGIISNKNYIVFHDQYIKVNKITTINNKVIMCAKAFQFCLLFVDYTHKDICNFVACSDAQQAKLIISSDACKLNKYIEQEYSVEEEFNNEIKEKIDDRCNVVNIALVSNSINLLKTMSNIIKKKYLNIQIVGNYININNMSINLFKTIKDIQILSLLPDSQDKLKLNDVQFNIKIHQFHNINELIKHIEYISLDVEKQSTQINIIKIFKNNKNKIYGCIIKKGYVIVGDKIVTNNKNNVKIISMKIENKIIDRANKNDICGIMFDNQIDLNVGDVFSIKLI